MTKGKLEILMMKSKIRHFDPSKYYKPKRTWVFRKNKREEFTAKMKEIEELKLKLSKK